MDVDGLTFACAMTVEERIARRLGRTALVGLGASRGVPEGRLVSFGIAGALAAYLPIGTVIDASAPRIRIEQRWSTGHGGRADHFHVRRHVSRRCVAAAPDIDRGSTCLRRS